MSSRFEVLTMKRIFSFRFLAWLMASFAGLCVLVVAVENWTGARSLASAKLRLEQSGETLDLSALRSKPISDAANFCAIGPLVGITLEDKDTSKSRHEAFRKLDWGQFWENNRSKLPTPALTGGCRLGVPFDFQQASAYLREVTYLDTPVNASPADALSTIDRLHSLLKELSDAAPDRTEAVFVPAVGIGYEGSPARMPVPHLNSAIHIVKGLALRSQVAVEAADSENAVRSIQASLRLTQALGKEPTLIGLLLAVTTSTYELNSIWSLLHRRVASETQMARLQLDLERQDFMRSALQSIRGELAFQTSSIEWYKRHSDRREDVYAPMKGFLGEYEPSWHEILLLRLIPAGWFDHNAATLIQLHSTWLLEPFKTGDVSRITHGFDELDRMLGERHGISSPHHMLPALSLPVFWSILRQAIYSEAVRRQACTAVAIERYRLAHAKLPVALGELVPVFLATVPLDPIDRQPMRYHIEGSAFTLWSIAMDRQDDRGKLPTKKEARHIERPEYTGDWVWKN